MYNSYKKICITNRKLATSRPSSRPQGGESYEKICLLDRVRQADADMVILREKDLPEEEYENLAKQIIEICQQTDKQCILHTFIKVAHRLDHPFIHLTMHDFLELSDAEKSWFQLIGVSTHSVEEAVLAEEKGASYITASHIFPTKCKEGLAPRGLDYLKKVKESVQIPVYALGGIHPENEKFCLDVGADGICMMSEYMKEKEIKYDLSRYERQMIMPEIGVEGQRKLHDAKVLIVGAGGLGSPAALYLASAGIGTLGIVDADEVNLTNLNRQVLHIQAKIGVNKAESAKEELLKRNDAITIHTYPYFLSPENAQEIISQYDFVIDAVDNFETKFLINDSCVLEKKPFCHAGVLQFHGQVLTYVPGQGPCYRCIFEEIPESGSIPNCSQVGIIGAAAGIIGCIQAMEAIKYFTATGQLLTGKMLTVDTLTMKFRLIPFPTASENCRVCGPNANIKDIARQKEEYQ